MAERNKDIIANIRKGNQSKTPIYKPRKQKLQFIKTNEPFLTDNQTQDLTKSSGDMQALKIRYLQSTINALHQENRQLKQQLSNRKNNSILNFNESKVKAIIIQLETIKRQLLQTKKQLDSSLVQRDFLQRNNKYLKNQCEDYINQIAQIRMNIRLANNQSKTKPHFFNKSPQQYVRCSSANIQPIKYSINRKTPYQNQNKSINKEYFYPSNPEKIQRLQFRSKSKKKYQSLPK